MIMPLTRQIRSLETGELYMRRTYLWGAPHMRDGSSPFGRFGEVLQTAERPRGTQCFLHKIATSDFRDSVHNHPWQWGKSLILSGGYDEERFFDADHLFEAVCFQNKTAGQLYPYGTTGWIVRRRVRPGAIVHLDGTTFHRVDLIEGRPAYTLFLAGPIRSGWGFLDSSGEFTKARDYRRKAAM